MQNGLGIQNVPILETSSRLLGFSVSTGSGSGSSTRCERASASASEGMSSVAQKIDSHTVHHTQALQTQMHSIISATNLHPAQCQVQCLGFLLQPEALPHLLHKALRQKGKKTEV